MGQGSLHVEAEVSSVCGLGFLPGVELGSPLGTGAQVGVPSRREFGVHFRHNYGSHLHTDLRTQWAQVGMCSERWLGSPLVTSMSPLGTS